jgi:hypothetical protein
MACGIDANANRELQPEADSSGYQLNAELCDVSRPGVRHGSENRCTVRGTRM